MQYFEIHDHHPGACPGFLKGGVQYLLVLKKGHHILKAGSNGLIEGGGVQYIGLPRTTNLAYLDVKE